MQLQNPSGPSAIDGQQVAGSKPPNPTYLPLGVPVPVLVLVSQGKLQWIMVLNLLVGHFLTDALGRYHSHHSPLQARGSGKGISWATGASWPGG